MDSKPGLIKIGYVVTSLRDGTWASSSGGTVVGTCFIWYRATLITYVGVVFDDFCSGGGNAMLNIDATFFNAVCVCSWYLDQEVMPEL